MKNNSAEKSLIVFDLDGTLLTSQNRIASSTKEAVSLLQAQGHLVTLASGRAPRAILPYYQELRLSTPLICYNGSLIVHPQEEKPLFEEMFPLSLVRDILSHFGESFFDNVMLESLTDQYYLKENQEFVYFFFPDGMKIHLGSVLYELKEDVFTMVLKLKDISDQAKVKDYIERKYPGYSIRFWLEAETFGEVYSTHADKGLAIAELARHCQIGKDNIIAFGDAMNDAKMMQAAGKSFAMRNGAEELKKLAWKVTETDNDHDGISIELKKLFSL